MKRIYLLIPLFLVMAISRGQTLTQSADGQSTIPLPLNGLGVSLDIGKADASFGVNNYGKVLSSRTHRFKDNFLMGANLSVKSADGLRQLFSSGDLVPEGNLLAFTGYSFSNKAAMLRSLSPLRDLDAQRKEEKEQLLAGYKQQIVRAIGAAAPKIANDQLRGKVVSGLWKNVLKSENANDIDKVLETAGKNPDNDQEDDNLKEFKKSLLTESAKYRKTFSANFEEIEKKFDTLNDIVFPMVLRKICPLRATFFLQGGISARGFTRYLGLNTTSLSKSFQDTLFRGGNIGLGANFQAANYWLGVTYSYLDGDNFASLRSKDYTLRTTDSARNQTLVGEKKVTAYAGKYSKVETNQLNIDLVGEYKLSDTSRVLVNLYLRSSLFSRDTSYLKNYTNIGAGFYFIDKKSKFLGGLYVELPDINNNFEKAKPADEVNIKSPFRKLTFGIVTKFSIASILGSN